MERILSASHKTAAGRVQPRPRSFTDVVLGHLLSPALHARPSRRIGALAPVVALLILSALPPWANAQPNEARRESSEPRIKFLDDLFFGSPSRRDPFEERIETERHDFTQSTKTVGKGVAQIEAGYTYFYKDNDGEIEQSHTTPETMLRLGISDDIEFRVRWDYAWRFVDEEEKDNVDGAEDLRWAFKLRVTDQACWMPESALEIRSTIPTGGNAWSTERVEFGLDYIYGWEIAEGWEIYGSTGFGTNALADFAFMPEEPASERFTVFHQSAALGVEVTERTTLYTEYYGLFTNALADNFSVNIFNMGVDYYVTDDFVLDFRIGVGLNSDADDLFTGIGGGYRF